MSRLRFSRVPCPDERFKGLGKRDLLVLLAIGRFANGSGEAFPSYATLASHSGVGRGKIADALARLESAGVIVRTQGRGIVNSYRLAFADERLEVGPNPGPSSRPQSGSEVGPNPVQGRPQSGSEVGPHGGASKSQGNHPRKSQEREGSLFPELLKPNRRKPDLPIPETDEFRRQVIALVGQLRPELNGRAAAIFDQFRDHALAHGRRCRDWPAAARTWIRREHAPGESSRHDPYHTGEVVPMRKPSPAQQMRDAIERQRQRYENDDE